MLKLKLFIIFMLLGSKLFAAEKPCDCAGAAEPQKVTVTIETPEKKLMTCVEVAQDPDASDEVQSSWMALSSKIKEEGFKIEQVANVLNALNKRVDMNENQKKAKENFIRRVEGPLMLMHESSPVAAKFRTNVREQLVKIDADLNKMLPADKPFAENDIVNSINAINKLSEQLSSLMKVDAAEAIKIKKEHDLVGHLERLKNALYLFKNTGHDSKNFRDLLLSQVQRALQTSSNLIEAKCRVLRAISGLI